MTNDKYYTPTLEEFYVGFEYEFRTLKGWDKKIMTWNDYPSYAGDYIGEAIKEIDGLRVKFLNKEDIESLDYIYSEEKSSEYHSVFRKSGYRITLHKATSQVDIDNGASYDMLDTFFQGTLKNKSELISQLKRCQIEI